MEGSESGSVQIIADLDLRSPKTYRSYEHERIPYRSLWKQKKKKPRVSLPGAPSVFQGEQGLFRVALPCSATPACNIGEVNNADYPYRYLCT